MQSASRRCAAVFIALVITFCCAGCNDQADEFANSAGSNAATPASDPLKFYLSDSPPTIKRKDWMQINGGAEAAYPNAPLLYLFTALKRNPRITNFRIDWGWAFLVALQIE